MEERQRKKKTDLSMRLPSLWMKAFTNNFSILHDYTSNHWIWASESQSLLCYFNTSLHVKAVISFRICHTFEPNSITMFKTNTMIQGKTPRPTVITNSRTQFRGPFSNTPTSENYFRVTWEN